jgi:hypothetical protein
MSLLLLFLGCRGSESETISEKNGTQLAFAEAQKAYEAAQTSEEKARIIQVFVDEYPEAPQVPDAVSEAVRLMTDELGQMSEAIAFVQDVSEKVEDPRARHSIDLELLELLANSGRSLDFQVLEEQIASQSDLTFVQLLRLIEVAAVAQDWDRITKRVAQAEPLANAGTFRKEWPDVGYSEQEIEVAGRNRKGLLLSFSGWAQANSDQLDDALETFARAEELTKKHYFGYPDSDLYAFWGKSLLMKGETEAAFEKLAPVALFGENKTALKNLQRAYLDTKGSEEGFEEFAWKYRKKSGKQIEDFALSDYADKQRSLSELRGKATLLSFWFPT